jgi:fructose-bisphosphate aldolase class II
VPDVSKDLTSPKEAIQFIESTKVDVFAPAVGNTHGMVQSMVHGNVRKRLDISRIREIKGATGSLLTLHGGSGTDNKDFGDAIAAGINIIHINTELRVAWRSGLEAALADMPLEIVPYKLLPVAEESVRKVVSDRLRLFNRQ